MIPQFKQYWTLVSAIPTNTSVILVWPDFLIFIRIKVGQFDIHKAFALLCSVLTHSTHCLIATSKNCGIALATAVVLCSILCQNVAENEID
jgi:hypothetical protein